MKTMFTSDIFNETADAICITTNGIINRFGNAVMGAGIAKQAKMRCLGIDNALGKKLASTGNHVYDMGVYSNNGNKHIVTFPTKNHWKDNSDIELIKQSCHELVALADTNNWTTVMLPPVGCGLGGLDFNTQVKPVISELLDDRFVICFMKTGSKTEQGSPCEDKSVEHDGHVISQCGSNHHVMIAKDGKILYHAAFDRDMTIEELIHFYDNNYQFIKKVSKKMFEHCFSPDYVDDDTEE